MDRKARDNVYLHKDFHGAMCYSIKYLDENFGPEATKEYLRQVARTVYSPLIEKTKAEGLSALEKHFKNIFTKEDGEFSISYEDNALVLKVAQCPAVDHLKKTNQLFTKRFCEMTVIVNDTICKEAGFNCSCDYEAGEGRCIQRFWK